MSGFGPAILVQLTIATAAALLAEAAMLKLRDKPLSLFLSDGSAIVTAWLIALTFPPLSPWWLIITGTLFAVIVAKHLYGGLGQNPFNPAMVAFAVCIVSFPALMSQWPAVGMQVSLADQISVVFGLMPRLDAISGATPLDTLKTALKLDEGTVSVAALLADQTVYGFFAGRGWEWVTGGYLLGGLFLWWRGIISWHAPLSFIAGLSLVAAGLWLVNPAQFANPLFHLFSGGAMLGAWFIVTDPVSGCTTPKGKMIFGFSAGVLAYVIRVFGGYPDGVAFAVLLMNLCVPLIDLYTQPAIFGMKDKS
jgi:electron transport complex protein RnfD